MIPTNVRQYIGELTQWALTYGRWKGCSDAEAIRADVTRIAASTVPKLKDPWDQETVVAEFQHAVDRAIEQRPKR